MRLGLLPGPLLRPPRGDVLQHWQLASVCQSEHTKLMVQRRQWFERPAQAHMVLC